MNSSEQILPLPCLAHLSALSFRRFSGEADRSALAAIQQARAETDQIDPHSSYEAIPTRASITAEYARAEAFAPRDTNKNSKIFVPLFFIGLVLGGCVGLSWLRYRWLTRTQKEHPLA